MKPKKLFNIFTTTLALSGIFSAILPKAVMSQASQDNSKIPVSVELFLSVDVSGSVNATEYKLQKQGYIDAFKDAEVIAAIEALPNGLAVAIETWSSDIRKTSGWYLIDSAEDATSFITAINSTLNAKSGSGGTDITKAMTSATDKILNNQYEGEALVIDISGDGISKNTSVGAKDSDTYNSYRTQVREYLDANANDLTDTYNPLVLNNYTFNDYRREFNNSSYKCSIGQDLNSDYSLRWKIPIKHLYCPPLKEAVTRAENNKITINGLPINGSATSNSGKKWREAEISSYYSHHIVTKDGFVRTAAGFDDFSRAVKEKLKCEITGIACAYAD